MSMSWWWVKGENVKRKDVKRNRTRRASAFRLTFDVLRFSPAKCDGPAHSRRPVRRRLSNRPASVHLRRLEPGAAADRRHHQVQRRVLRVAALVHQVLGRFMLRADLHELRRWLVVFAEVGAQAALTIVYMQHVEPPIAFDSGSRIQTSQDMQTPW